MIPRKPYPTDVSDREWDILGPLIPARKVSEKGGRPPACLREVINGIRYVLRSGCAWRLMPHEFPKWRTCYRYFRMWKKDGIWKKIHDGLRGDVREAAGRQRQPSAAIIDSQSVKTTEKGGSTDTTPARRSMGASATS